MTTTDLSGPLPETALRVRRHPPSRINEWLKRGWRDMRRIGWPSYAHGAVVFLASVVILRGALYAEYLLPGLATAFVLVGPMLATGLYALSRQLEDGNPTRLADAVNAWRTSCRCLFGFGLLLIAAGLAWVITSTVLFKLFVKVPIDDAGTFVRYVLTQEFENFMLWTLLGSLGAALVFAATVITVPLMLDRNITTKTAILTSIHVVGENPVTMVLWALVIAFATGLSMATGMLGFIILYPLMGHASWHAYRDLAEVDDQAVPQRPE